MSFNLKRGTLLDQNFLQAMETLNNVRMPNKMALEVLKLGDSMARAYNATEDGRIKILDTHQKKNPDGSLKTRKGQPVFKDEEALKAEMIEYLSEDVEIDADKLFMEDLTSCGITPNEVRSIALLAPIMHGKEEEKKAE